MNPFFILSGVKRQRNAVEESLTVIPGTLEQKTVRDVSTALDMTKRWHHVAV